MRLKGLALATVAGACALATAAPASAATLYVDDGGTDAGPNDCTSPAAPCGTIAYALGLTGTDTIHIGGGSYTEAVGISESETLVEDSGFSGAAAGQAILTSPSGQVAVEYFSPGTVQGLTIRSDENAVRFAAGGSLTGNTFDTSALPGGLYNADVVIDAFGAFSPTITGNTFVDSVPDAQFGVVANSTGSPTISGNTFSGFRQAILALQGAPATPTITGNEITGTHGSSGAGIGTSGPALAPTITGNFIHSPGAGGTRGIDVASGGVATLSRNRVVGHEIGVSIGTASSASMSSDLIVKADDVGLAVSVPTSATNITVADSQGTAEVAVDGDPLTLDSSIVHGNPNGILPVSGGTCTTTFSRGTGSGACAAGFTSTADPMFVNPAANDYHLAAGSPMIDMGDPGDPGPGALDVDGDARALGVGAQCTTPPAGRRDIGADEFITPCPPPVTDPPVTTPPAKKKCKKGQKLKKGKCVKKKRKRKRR